MFINKIKLSINQLLFIVLATSCSHSKNVEFRKPAQSVILSDITYFLNSNAAWANTIVENLNRAFLKSNECSMAVEAIISELPKLDLTKSELSWFHTEGLNYLNRSANIKFHVNGRMSEIPLECRVSVSSFFTKLRDLDEYVGERAYKIKSLHGETVKFQLEPVPIVDSHKYNKHFVNPKIANFKFERGDVMITRGVSFISAAIAQSTKQPSKFSHGVFVHVNESGKTQTIESYINSGVKYYSIEDALKNENTRIMVFRNKDKNLARSADKVMSDMVNKVLKEQGQILYDYDSDYSDHSRLTCIEIPFAAYEMASNKKLILPQVSSELRLNKPDIISGLNIKPGKIFSPFNIETDDRFELVLDWTDYRLTQDQRNKDAVLAEIFDLIENKDYVLQENLTTIGARAIWKTRSIPFIWNMLGGIGKLNELPAELPLKQIVTTAKLNKVGNIILNDLRQWQSAHPEKIYTTDEIKNWLQFYVSDGYEKYSMGLRSDLHTFFRPQALEKLSTNK